MSNLAYTIEKRQRRKTASISVSPKNEIHVIVPEHLSDEQVQAVVDRKAEWIRSKIRFNSEVKYPYKPREYVSGEAFTYLGRNYRLKVIAADAAPVKLDNGRFFVQVPSNVNHHERGDYILSELTLWYQSRGLKKLKERVAMYAKRFDLKPVNVVVKDLRSQWGSCTSRGEIAFNWKIAIAPISIMDYVVAHELCHLIHHDHSKEYWRLLESVMPDYKERKEWLRVNGGLLTLK
ncbi:MAG: M48 family metallopeptidase [Armatimonadota bacterium]